MDSPSSLVLLLVTSIVLVKAIQRSQEKRQGMFGVDQGKVLRRHVFEKHRLTSAVDCGRHCTANAQCLSFNYKEKGPDVEDVCELNNATRKIASPGQDDSDSRYQHYYDLRTESYKFRSCLDYLRQGSTLKVIYTIRENDKSYKVWCDMTSEPGSSWTLILSFALKNRNNPAFCSRSFRGDSKANDDVPRWEAYRMSLKTMKLLASQSTHWRAT
ncbi:uncharacterized protein LOC116291312 [Actinia tenebrosa]|uniref:Uncharacterized protein LOC116291312 n=1 Tax=Actinia tenebrosa TaxID=6105 RepID=A0A6P8HHB3_ACTTE|nr:uncharacterized protein LOC116291312 [Actinia tenebrosa]